MFFRSVRHLPVRLCIIVLSVVALAGCAGRKQPVEDGVVTLTFYNYATPEFLKLYHEDLIPEMRGGIFIEMTGNDNNLALQHSRQGQAVIEQYVVELLLDRVLVDQEDKEA